jgi:hypothetical protein
MATRRALRAEVTASFPRRSTVMPYSPPVRGHESVLAEVDLDGEAG